MLNSDYPEFWNNMYDTGSDVWSLNKATPVFVQLLEEQKFIHPSKLLIPGCGTGHEARYATEKGYDVTVIDFSESALSKLKENSGTANINYLQENFFDLKINHPEKFDFVFEYVTICSVLPEKRELFLQNMYSALKKGGKFISLLFPITKEYDSPPPYKIDFYEFLYIAEKYFSVELISNSVETIKPRTGNEILLVLRKN